MNKNSTVRLRSAHVFLKDGRAVVASNWRVIQPERNAARVLFSGVRFHKAQDKPTLASVLSVLAKEAA